MMAAGEYELSATNIVFSVHSVTSVVSNCFVGFIKIFSVTSVVNI